MKSSATQNLLFEDLFHKLMADPTENGNNIFGAIKEIVVVAVVLVIVVVVILAGEFTSWDS